MVKAAPNNKPTDNENKHDSDTREQSDPSTLANDKTKAKLLLLCYYYYYHFIIINNWRHCEP